MKVLLSLVATMALLVASSAAQAEGVKSGLQKGEKIGAFYVDKYAGNKNDNVEVGQTLCYRCKLGNRPVVTVFARQVDDKLTGLVKEIDVVVEENKDKKMAAFVSLLEDDKDKVKKSAQRLVEKSKAKNIAVVAPAESKKGWDKLHINDEADVTVLVYNKGVIEANYAFINGQLDKDAVAKIVADAKKMVQ